MLSLAPLTVPRAHRKVPEYPSGLDMFIFFPSFFARFLSLRTSAAVKPIAPAPGPALLRLPSPWHAPCP
jgi:hypothetical protein